LTIRHFHKSGNLRCARLCGGLVGLEPHSLTVWLLVRVRPGALPKSHQVFVSCRPSIRFRFGRR
jgi:hypothetical protein